MLLQKYETNLIKQVKARKKLNMPKILYNLASSLKKPIFYVKFPKYQYIFVKYKFLVLHASSQKSDIGIRKYYQIENNFTLIKPAEVATLVFGTSGRNQEQEKKKINESRGK